MGNGVMGIQQIEEGGKPQGKWGKGSGTRQGIPRPVQNLGRKVGMGNTQKATWEVGSAQACHTRDTRKAGEVPGHGQVIQGKNNILDTYNTIR